MQNLSRRDAARTLAATAVIGMAAVSAEASTADPVFGLIAKADAARAVYDKEEARIKALQNKMPAEIRDWPGVFCGTWQSPRGPRPMFRRPEKSVRAEYAEMRASEFRTPGGKTKFEQMARDAIAEAHDMNERERAAYRDVGLPFKPGVEEDGEDEYFRPYFTRIWDAEEAVIRCAPVTIAGLLAKVGFLVSRPELEALGGKTADQVQDESAVFSEAHYLARLGEDAARLAGHTV